VNCQFICGSPGSPRGRRGTEPNELEVIMANYVGRVCVAGSFVIASLLAAGVGAQTPAAQQAAPKVKSVRTVPINSVEGKDNYVAYCAVCHGLDGKGKGPAAPAMKAPVPDLTTIAQRNKGKFDLLSIEYIITGTGKTATPAHGVEDMPIWGDVFQGDDRSKTILRIGNLAKYLESIQQK
jgi:mono/diheme cytochrome c family protein